MKTNIKQQQTFLSAKDLKKVKVVETAPKGKVEPAVDPTPAKKSNRKPTMSSSARAYILAHGGEMLKPALMEGLWVELSTKWALPLEKKWYCAWYISDMGRKGQIPGYITRAAKQQMATPPVVVEPVQPVVAAKKAKK